MSKVNKLTNKIKMDELEVLNFEEQLILQKIKQQKKHYLNPQSKSFIHKFLKIKRVNNY